MFGLFQRDKFIKSGEGVWNMGDDAKREKPKYKKGGRGQQWFKMSQKSKVVIIMPEEALK